MCTLFGVARFWLCGLSSVPWHACVPPDAALCMCPSGPCLKGMCVVRAQCSALFGLVLVCLCACVRVCCAMAWRFVYQTWQVGEWSTQLAEARPRLAHVLLCLCNLVVEVGFLLSGQHPCSCLVPL